MSAPTERQSLSADPNAQDAVCRLERRQSADPYADNPTHLFLEPLGMEVWRLRVTAGQLALPACPR
jgi:hypothetical protein